MRKADLDNETLSSQCTRDYAFTFLTWKMMLSTNVLLLCLFLLDIDVRRHRVPTRRCLAFEAM